MEDTTIISIVSLTISVVGSIIAIVNHKRIRSACCGKIFTASLDIENTTPTKSLAPIDVQPSSTTA
jgi:hypothetical protein